MSPNLRIRTPRKENGPNTPRKSAKSNAVVPLDPGTPSKNTRSKAGTLAATPAVNLKDRFDAADTLTTSPSTSPASVSSSSPKSSPKQQRLTRKISPKNIKTISPKKPASPAITIRRSARATPRKTSPSKETPSKRTQAKTSAKSPSAKKTPAQGTPAKKTSGKKTSDQKLIEEQAVELNTYQKYKHALSTTIKSKLVFREKEANEIRSFLEEHLSKQTSSSIYISGNCQLLFISFSPASSSS